MKIERPKDDHTPDGRRIVYPIWRDDLAEATVFPSEREIELLVQSFLLPPPLGFTEQEKKQILDWVRSPSAFVEMAKRRKAQWPVNERVR